MGSQNRTLESISLPKKVVQLLDVLFFFVKMDSESTWCNGTKFETKILYSH